MPSEDQNGAPGKPRPSSITDRGRAIPAEGNQDYESVPDPFGDGEANLAHPLSSSGQTVSLPQRGRSRGRGAVPAQDGRQNTPRDPIPALDTPKVTIPIPPKAKKPVVSAVPPQATGPGLSPGVPHANNKAQTVIRRSDAGIVLTPSGVQQARPMPAKPASGQKSGPKPDSDGAAFYKKSRSQNADDDASWEEYAADDFPAMAAQDFGVKTGKTQSGRIVPVGIRSDLTDEALKGRSVGDKGKKQKRLPSPKDAKAKSAPKSLFGRVSARLRSTKAAPEAPKTGFAKSGSQATKTKRTTLGSIWMVASEIGKILILVLVLRAYVVQVSKVRGPSMEGTLYGGERLIVERVTSVLHNNRDEPWFKWIPASFMPAPERGDIVVIRSPEDPGTELVKRLIALGGDEIKFEDGHLFIKKKGGTEFEQVNEPYINAENLKNPDGTFNSYSIGDIPANMDNGESLLVPEGRIFVMGDNRDQSNDSRRWLNIRVNKTSDSSVHELWATENSIEGIVIFRLWPTDRIGTP